MIHLRGLIVVFLSAYAAVGQARPGAIEARATTTGKTTTTTTHRTTTTTTKSKTTTTTTTAIPVTTTPPCGEYEVTTPIIASTPGTAVYDLQLFMASPGTSAGLTTVFTGGWNFLNGGLGLFDQCNYWWLNVGAGPYSYKSLTFAYDELITNSWVGGKNETISVDGVSSFLACQVTGNTAWTLYLQTGTDFPSGEIMCYETQLTQSTVFNYPPPPGANLPTPPPRPTTTTTA